MKEGTWPQDCIQRAFVDGASWWQFHHNGSTMFGSERLEAEAEAVKCYGEPKQEPIVELTERRMAQYFDWLESNLQALYDNKPLLPRLEWDKPGRKVFTYGDMKAGGKL